MSMARIDNGEVVATRLPHSGQLADGRTVSNYHRLPGPTLRNEGWREIVDDGPPTHDPATHQARRTGHTYDATADVVRVDYEIVERPADPGAGDHLDPQIGAPDA